MAAILRSTLLKRLLWFVGLWAAGVGVTALPFSPIADSGSVPAMAPNFSSTNRPDT